MKYIMPKETILNTMITVYEQEKRRIIDGTDVENYQERLREKLKREESSIAILGWTVGYLDDERVFKNSYFSASKKKKLKILEHYLYGDIICNEELLSYLCPFKGSSEIIQYYMMFPWIDIKDLYEARRELELPDYGILEDTLGIRTPADLEKLLDCERKVSCFFTDNLKEELTSLQKKSESATKVLNKVKKVSNHSGK